MRLTLLAAVAAIALAAAPGPARAQIAVIDAKAIAQLLLDYERQGLILKQEVDTYLQLMENARGLADLDRLLRRLGLSPREITADMLRLVLNEAYNLDPDSPTYRDQLRTIQQDRYILPRTKPDITATYNDLYAPGDAARLSQGYDKYLRDYEQYGQYSNVLNDALKERSDAYTEIQNQNDVVSTLTDNNMGATLQAMATQNVLFQRQMDIMIKLNGVAADQQIQTQLRELEREVSLEEQKIAESEKRRKFREAPHADITRYPFSW
jgi:hypothetical protein